MFKEIKITDEEEVVDAVHAIWWAYRQARSKHRAMQSWHEGYAVTLEEVDELWDAIKRDRTKQAASEARQVGAMAVAMLAELD